MRTSEQIDKLAEALSKAQGEFINPDKNKIAKIPMKSGGSYSYAYADLPEILNSTRKALFSNQLSHTMGLRYAPNIVLLIGRLMHSSGQWIESEYEISRNTDPKTLAASITYGRRYVFTALLGIAADEDTDEAPEDGADYEDKKPQPPKTNPANSPIKPKSSFEMGPAEIQKIKELSGMAKVTKDQLSDVIKAKYKKPFMELNEQDYNHLIKFLQDSVQKTEDRKSIKDIMDNAGDSIIDREILKNMPPVIQPHEIKHLNQEDFD